MTNLRKLIPRNTFYFWLVKISTPKVFQTRLMAAFSCSKNVLLEAKPSNEEMVSIKVYIKKRRIYRLWFCKAIIMLSTNSKHINVNESAKNECLIYFTNWVVKENISSIQWNAYCARSDAQENLRFPLMRG